MSPPCRCCRGFTAHRPMIQSQKQQHETFFHSSLVYLFIYYTTFVVAVVVCYHSCSFAIITVVNLRTYLQPSDSHQSISIQPVAVGRIHTHSLTTNEKEGRLSIMTSETNDDDVPVLNNNNNDADDDEAKEEVTDLSSRYVHAHTI